MRRAIVATLAVALGCISAAAAAQADTGEVGLPALTCAAIIDAAQADGVLDGDGDMDACIAEAETSTAAEQEAIATALLGG